MSQKRKGKKRLKLYVPEKKMEHWRKILDEKQPYSDFHSNFSSWVKSCFQRIPEKDVIPLYLNHPLDSHIIIGKKEKKIEKTIWISAEMKNALKLKKGVLSLNSFVLLLLDLNVYGGASENQRIFQIFYLQKRINELDNKLNQLTDKAYITAKTMIK
jgi:hypothetical protein